LIRSALAEAVILVALLAPAVARADDVQEARRRFDLAEEQYARGSYEEAYASYEAAYQAAPLPDFLFNMGQCQRKLGRPREALALYRRFLDSGPSADRRAIVEGIVRDISVTLPEDIPPPVPHVDERPAPPPPRGETRTSGRFRLRAPTWIAAGGAVVLLGVTGLFALQAQSGQDDLDALDCSREMDACLEAKGDAQPWFLAQNLTLAAAGGALAVAVVLAILDAGASSETPAVTLAPIAGPRVAGLGAAGRF
jgi:tetratricopeptide (TPR) repeat protein